MGGHSAIHIVRAAYRFNLAKRATKQSAVVACAIFIVATLLNVERKPKLKDVAVVCKVSEVSVQSVYDLLYPHIGKLLPADFRGGLADHDGPSSAQHSNPGAVRH